MIRKLFITGLLLLTVASSPLAQSNISFPEDFTIPENKIPGNFIPEPLNDEARQAGVTKNPGIVKNPAFIGELYDNVDIAAIEALHIAMYVPKDDPDFELGIYTIAYRSPEDLKSEMEKMSMYAGSRYLFTGRYMVRVWGDSGSFEQQVNYLADYLKQKLSLREFFPPANEENNMETTEVSTE